MRKSDRVQFDEWYQALQDLARVKGESVADRAAWRESYLDGDDHEEAFYSEYPEHRETPIQ